MADEYFHKLFFTKDEACTLLRVSLSTLNRWLKNRILPSRKIGGRVLIPAEAIIKLAAPDTCQEVVA